MIDTYREVLNRDRGRRLRAAVVGDVIIDEYVQGTLTRLAQEQPVPIFESRPGTEYRLLGGAGNVARQFKHWNADVKIVALVDDETEELCEHANLRTCHCVGFYGLGRNPVKRRLCVDDREICRHDIETVGYGLPQDVLSSRLVDLVGKFQRLLDEGLDLVLLCDYGKGLFDQSMLAAFIQTAREAGVLTIADPHHHRAPQDYLGVDVLKLNDLYARRWPRFLVGKVNVCTRGADAPTIFSLDDTKVCVMRPPVHARSVVGAGDCFAAHLGLALAHGLEVKDAAEIAHSAGRVYVQRQHNRPVHPLEIGPDLDSIAGKIVDGTDLADLLLRVGAPQTRVVFTNGCFDGLHPGHVRTLNWARQQGDLLIVAVNDDEGVCRLKGRGRPAVPLPARLLDLAALASVDYVVSFAGDTPEWLIEALRPSVLIKGPEYAGQRVPGDHLVPDVRFAPASGYDLHSSDLLSASFPVLA